jgi:hypothetical protein
MDQFHVPVSTDAPDSHGLNFFPEERVKNPNADFGGTPGAIWDEGGGEDLAHIIHAAFVRNGVLFEAYAGVVREDLGTSLSTDTAAKEATAILTSIEPY